MGGLKMAPTEVISSSHRKRNLWLFPDTRKERIFLTLKTKKCWKSWNIFQWPVIQKTSLDTKVSRQQLLIDFLFLGGLKWSKKNLISWLKIFHNPSWVLNTVRRLLLGQPSNLVNLATATNESQLVLQNVSSCA